MSFVEEVIHWYRINKRALPWRDTTNPYMIWVSEVILQQTRVAQGLPYFLRFTKAFPTVESLANSEESVLLREWQGLGYYSRARNMHKTARIVTSKFKGRFPTNFNTLMTLPGIGAYTAAAISSFAAGECHAVVDGNVSRVLARYFGIMEPINSKAGQTIIANLSNELIPCENPAEYNQAIMEYGALHCTPRIPKCSECALCIACVAYNNGSVNTLPIKTKAKKKKDRYFHYFILRDENERIRIQQRTGADIWQNLYELPLIEAASFQSVRELFNCPNFQEQFGSHYQIIFESSSRTQTLSHQKIHAKFYELKACGEGKNHKANYVFIKDLDKLAKPKLMVSFFDDYFKDTF